MRKITAILPFLALSAFGAEASIECSGCESISLPPLNGADTVAVKPAYRWSQGEAETNKVDILIAYDASAMAWLSANGCGTPEEFARTEVDCVNAGLANTGLDRLFTFRFAGARAVAADFSAKKIKTTLVNFIGSVNAKTDAERAAVAEVRALRDTMAADVVAVLVDLNEKSTYGISYKFLKEDLSSRGLEELAQHGYCVCDITTLKDRFTLMHELGHIFGAGHDDEQFSDPGPQLMEYSSGYRFEADGVLHTTVMGITSSAGKAFIRWPFFSSPLYTFGENGPVVGTVKRNDNTRTLRETYHIIANYRVASPLPESQGSAADSADGDGISLSVERISGSGGAVADGSTVQTVRYVNETFRITASASGDSKATVKVKGLPSGMKYSAKTGLITGYPKKAGSYGVTVTARCRGFETVTRQFTVLVEGGPASLPGTYVGLAEADGESSVLTFTVAATGKVTLKGRIKGKNRTFRAAGMESASTMEDGGTAFTVRPEAKVGGESKSLELSISDRIAGSSGFSGLLRQIPWGRKDISAPRIAKTFSVEAGDFQCRIRSNGRARLSGRVAGAMVSGMFQLVPENPWDTGDGSVFILPVSFPAKKSFPGFAGELRFRISVGADGKVSRIEWMGE